MEIRPLPPKEPPPPSSCCKTDDIETRYFFNTSTTTTPLKENENYEWLQDYEAQKARESLEGSP